MAWATLLSCNNRPSTNPCPTPIQVQLDLPLLLSRSNLTNPFAQYAVSICTKTTKLSRILILTTWASHQPCYCITTLIWLLWSTTSADRMLVHNVTSHLLWKNWAQCQQAWNNAPSQACILAGISYCLWSPLYCPKLPWLLLSWEPQINSQKSCRIWKGVLEQCLMRPCSCPQSPTPSIYLLFTPHHKSLESNKAGFLWQLILVQSQLDGNQQLDIGPYQTWSQISRLDKLLVWIWNLQIPYPKSESY